MRINPSEILHDGNPIRFLGWVPYQGLGTPSFPTHPSMRATVINHARDRDRRASRSPRERKRSISFGVPLGKGTGVFWRAGRPPEWNAPTRLRSAINSGEILGTGTASTRDQQVADFGRGFAAHRKRDFSSV